MNFLLSLHHNVMCRSEDVVCREKKNSFLNTETRAVTQVVSTLVWNSWCLMSTLCRFQVYLVFKS